MASLSPTPRQQFFDAAGVPLVGGKVYTYAGGTTTPIATYTTQAGNVNNTNPIILDSRGQANIWLFPSIAYKYVITDANDVTQYTVDNILVPIDDLSFSSPPPMGDVAPNSGAFTTLSATDNVTFTGSGATQLQVGSTSDRPTPVIGMIRYNSALAAFEGYGATGWSAIGGGAGATGTQRVRASIDGHTLLFAGTGALTAVPKLQRLFYSIADFTPIANLIAIPYVLATKPNAPFRDMAGFLAAARARPEGLSYGTPGIGSTPHLAAELFKSATGLDIVHLPYSGAAPAVTDLVAGRTQLMFADIPVLLPHVQAGSLRALAVGSPGRAPVLPDTPTLKELGLPDGTEGVLLSGGSMASTTALVAARAHRGPGVLYLSDQTHSSIKRGALALVLLLDQFTRNIHRDTPQAFDCDAQALQLAQDLINTKADRNLRRIERVFCYLPLEHSESIEMQNRSVELFSALVSETPEHERDTFTGYADFAVRHRDIIARFGRFPHRNRMLGRASTPEELEFLLQPGSSF